MENLLLNYLERNAKMNVTTLADMLAASESDVLETLSDLEKEKVILGYHTIINWDKTNTEKVNAMIMVDATPEREYGYDRIAKKIYAYPEVEDLYLMSGKSDFILMVEGKTMKDIADFTATKLACIDGVTGTNTIFIMQTYKANGFIYAEEENKRERLVVTP